MQRGHVHRVVRPAPMTSSTILLDPAAALEREMCYSSRPISARGFEVKVPFRDSPVHWFGLGILVTTGLWAACPRFASQDAGVWPERRRLAELLGPFRPGHGRWLGLPYAGPGTPLGNVADRPRLRQLGVPLGAPAGGSPERLADRALLKAAAGRRRDAVTALQEAVELAPDDPRFASDLAAALLARAEADRRPLDLVLAFEAATAALRVDPHFEPALFNQAQALEGLFLADPARMAWRRLRQRDAASPWAREADAALRRAAGTTEAAAWDRARQELFAAIRSGHGGGQGDLEAARVAAVAARFSQPARQLAEDSLLGAWAEARESGKPQQAAATLRVARAIGAALAIQNHDLLLRDTIAAIEAALSADPHDGRLARLVEGHRAYRAARSLYETGAVARSAREFARARAALAAAGSPFAGWAALWESICTYYLPDPAAARLQLAQLDGQVTGERYPTLAGRIQWMLGLIDFETGGDWSRALVAFRAALARFQACHEAENAAAVENLLAVTFDYLGDEESAWLHRIKALAGLPRVIDARRRLNILGTAARSLNHSHPAAGLPFAETNLAAANASGRPQIQAAAYWESALLEQAVGKRDAAAADLAKARARVEQVPDPSFRLQQSADIDLTAGMVLGASAPREALAALQRALDFYRRARYSFSVPQILAERARIYRVTGQDSFLEAELQLGIEAIEALSGRLSERELRNSYLEHTLDIYDEMARFQVVRQHRPASGFDYAERRRARQLADTFGVDSGARREPGPAAASKALSLAAVQQSLQPGTALIQYLVAGDALITFVLRRDGVACRVAEQQAPALAQLSAALLATADRLAGDSRMTQLLADLGRRLLRPVLPDLAGASRLVFVPDKMLFAVPFAALVDPRDGTYLVEHYGIVTALSATSYARAGRRPRLESAAATGKTGAKHALLVGDPAFNPDLFPSLQRLPGALAEIEDLRRLYPDASVLAGAAATRAAFLAGMETAEVVQFSGHAVVDPDLPGRSVLVLADQPGGATGALYVHDLAGLSLPATRLVFLAACSTGRGNLSQTDGIASLARPFLSAGAPAVIATLWNVEDLSAGQLSRRLHRRLAAGEDAMNALRDAQLELLHGSDSALRPPRAWAAYELLGANLAPAGWPGQPSFPSGLAPPAPAHPPHR
jgi:CHAT domain-containing protein